MANKKIVDLTEEEVKVTDAEATTEAETEEVTVEKKGFLEKKAEFDENHPIASKVIKGGVLVGLAGLGIFGVKRLLNAAEVADVIDTTAQVIETGETI